MKYIHTEGIRSILRSRFARGLFPLMAALLAFALAAPEARAAVAKTDFSRKMPFISLAALPSCLSSMMTASSRLAFLPVRKLVKARCVSMVRRSVSAGFTRVMREKAVRADGESSAAWNQECRAR